MSKRKIIAFLALSTLLLVLAVAGAALAQSDASLAFDLSWFSIDSGGGSSSGGAYALSGTIGQPNAGTISSGSYTIYGGLWVGGIPITLQRIYLPLVRR